MEFRLHPARPIQDEVHRVAQELIDDASSQLAKGGAEIHAGIHDARKDLKKIRSLLRLVKDPIGESYEVENRCFRDLGRSLASTRDREAMIEAFDTLVGEGAAVLRPDLVQRTREHLVRSRDELLVEDGSFDQRRGEILAALEESRARVVVWKLHGEGFSMIESGLRRAFRAVRRAGQEAQLAPGPESYHEWRKRSKIHWHHMRLLADVWAEESEAWRTGLDRLNDVLGDHQDLELLIELADSGIPHYTHFESEQLRQMLRRRQDRLRDEAAHLGVPYLAEKPSALLTHLRHAWERASETA